MYAYFKGIIEEKYEDGIVIEVNGIGYNIIMAPGKTAILPDEGNEVRIYTYTNVREDAISLFGFIRKDELNMFKLLITVSGIGPRMAMSLLAALSPEQIKLAIYEEDVKALTLAQGLGKKIAERAIVDLKDKVDKLELHYGDDFGPVVSLNDSKEANNFSMVIGETKEALISLGIPANQAEKAVKEAYNDSITDSETLLKEALKHIG